MQHPFLVSTVEVAKRRNPGTLERSNHSRLSTSYLFIGVGIAIAIVLVLLTQAIWSSGAEHVSCHEWWSSLTAAATQTEKIEESSSAIERLGGDIASDTTDLKNAASIRAKEATDFAAGEKELSEVIDTPARAVTTLDRETQKKPCSFRSI